MDEKIRKLDQSLLKLAYYHVHMVVQFSNGETHRFCQLLHWVLRVLNNLLNLQKAKRKKDIFTTILSHHTRLVKQEELDFYPGEKLVMEHWLSEHLWLLSQVRTHFHIPFGLYRKYFHQT